MTQTSTQAPFSVLPDGRLRVESGPVSLLIAARWDGKERPEELREAGVHALDLLKDLAAHRAVLTVEASRVRNRAALPPIVGTMLDAAARFPGAFVTPLAAVAGAVADSVADFLAGRGAEWVVVNNGGDVAVRLGPGQRAVIGLQARLGDRGPAARFTLTAEDAVGGVTTSGAGGRSFTLGIAEAVTTLAETASLADVAATLVANHVDVDSPAVRRVPARALYSESDLGDRRVTVHVGDLTHLEVSEALDRGAIEARKMVDAGQVRGAVLSLRGQWRFVGWPGEGAMEWLRDPVG